MDEETRRILAGHRRAIQRARDDYRSARRAYDDAKSPLGTDVAIQGLQRIQDRLRTWGSAWEDYATEFNQLGLEDAGEVGYASQEGAAFFDTVLREYDWLNRMAAANGIAPFAPSEDREYSTMQYVLCRVAPANASAFWDKFSSAKLPVGGFDRGRGLPGMRPPRLVPSPSPGPFKRAGSEPAPSNDEAPKPRVLDAAIASHIVKGKTAELDVLVRLPDSQGLAGMLLADETAEPRPEDVLSKRFQMTFPVGPDGRPRPRKADLSVEAPNFDPPKQSKSIFVPPDADSEVVTFFMAPTATGRLPILVELQWEEALRGQRTLRTECVAEAAELPSRPSRNLVQLPIDVSHEGKEQDAAGPAAPNPPVAYAGKPSRDPTISSSHGAAPSYKPAITPSPWPAAPSYKPATPSSRPATPSSRPATPPLAADPSASRGSIPKDRDSAAAPSGLPPKFGPGSVMEAPQSATLAAKDSERPKALARRSFSPIALAAAAVAVLGGMGIAVNIAFQHPLQPKPDSLAQCFQTVLTQKETLNNDAALTLGESLARLVGVDSSGAAIALTTTSNSTAESRAISDETVRFGLQECVRARALSSGSGTLTLPEIVATATVRAHAESGRPLANVTIQRASDQRQGCQTEASGACDLTLLHLSSTKDVISFVAEAMYRRPANKAVSVDDFLKGLDFSVENYPTLSVVVTQNGELVRDRGSVMLDPGANFPVWSQDCQDRNSAGDCYTQRIDSQGRAVFYYSKPFERLSISTFVEGHSGAVVTPVLDPKSLPASISVDLGRAGTGTKYPSPPAVPACTVWTNGSRLGKCSEWCGAAPNNITDRAGNEQPTTEADCRQAAALLCRQKGRPICTYKFQP
jgi:hypothetical protein